VWFGEAPGPKEDEKGCPFIGASGDEVDAALNHVGLERGTHVRVDNVIRCKPPEDDTAPRWHELNNCRSWTNKALARMGNLKLMVACGGAAIRTFLPQMKNYRVEQIHGILYRRKDGMLVYPMVHPAAGMRDADFFEMWLRDVKGFRPIVRELMDTGDVKNARVVGEWANTGKYRWVNKVDELRDLITAHNVNEPISLDTESTAAGDPWTVQITWTEGIGYILDATNVFMVGVLRLALHRRNQLVIAHNAPYDLDVLAKLEIYPKLIHDTMAMAYLLGEPQALKTLAFRRLNMKMQDYEDLVSPFSRAKYINYLCNVAELEWSQQPKERLIKETAGYRMKKITPIRKRIKKILDDAEAKPDDTDVRKRWKSVEPEDGRAMVEKVLGPMLGADLRDVQPQSDVTEYAGKDPDVTHRVWKQLNAEIDETGQRDAFNRDMRMLPMVVDMSLSGWEIAPPAKFRELRAFYTNIKDEVLDELKRDHGVHSKFNPNSALQCAEYLFDQLKLPKIDGRSTKSGILKELAEQNEAARLIQEWRHADKMISSFLDSILEHVKPDGRVHARIKTTRVVTGRLATADPNLMAQPTRTKESKRIRECFVAGKDCVLVSADYSQVELRVLAHAARVERLIRAFIEGDDPHAITAATMFNIPLVEVQEKLHRYPAKRTGFGVVFGISPEGLQRTMIEAGIPRSQWPLERCAELIYNYKYETYPEVGAFMSRVAAEAKRCGFVVDMFGRRRPVPHAKSKARWLRRAAEREAGNAPIQSSAQGYMKEAMGRMVPVYRKWRKRNFTCDPVMQIHDDLIMRVHKSIVNDFVPEMVDIMEAADVFAGKPLDMGLKVDVKVSDLDGNGCWANMEKWKA